MDFISAIVLGLVEGLTEFLPISSTGHLIIANQFFHFTEDFTKVFDIVIQLGAILAVVIYFRKKIFVFNPESFSLWKKVIVAVLPAIAFGALLNDFIEEKLFNPMVVAITLLIGGLVILWVENKKRNESIVDLKTVTYKFALAIGLIQCLAMVPGVSRSGATIIGAMLLGLSRLAATEFSFFLAIPTMCAATGYSLLKNADLISGGQWGILSLGILVAFFSAFLVVSFLMKFISTHTFKFFGYYRIILALVIMLLMFY